MIITSTGDVISNFDGIICAIIDAKNDNVYSGIYRDIALYNDTSAHRLELIDEYSFIFSFKFSFNAASISISPKRLLRHKRQRKN